MKLPPPPGAVPGRSGQLPTGRAALAALSDHAPARAVRAHRAATARLEWVAELVRGGLGTSRRVHPSLRQTAASSGRLPVDAPPLQTLPRALSFGSEFVARAFVSAPRAAIAAPRGQHLVVTDYRQLELRIAAHLSGDEGLLAAFNGAADPLAAVAATVHGVPLEAVTATQRHATKAVAYGLMYGMGDAQLADALDVDEKRAASVRAGVAAALPGLAAWTDAVTDAVRKDGCVRTLGGRTRTIDLDGGGGGGRARHHGGTATSFAVQGTAADIFKGALLQLDGALKDGDAAAGLPPSAARIVLQVHDEVVVEVVTGGQRAAATTAAIVTRVLQGQATAWGLRVPLPVKTAVVARWSEVE